LCAATGRRDGAAAAAATTTAATATTAITTATTTAFTITIVIIAIHAERVGQQPHRCRRSHLRSTKWQRGER